MGPFDTRRHGNTLVDAPGASTFRKATSRRLFESVGIVAALASFSLSPVWAQEGGNEAKTATKPAPGVTQSVTNTLANLQDAFATIADNLEPAVVTVTSTRSLRTASDGDREGSSRGLFPFGRGSAPRRSTGTGTGLIISKDGWVLTNDHVVGGADKVTIKMHDGREFVGTVRRDYRSDLALVKISSATPLPVAPLGDSDKVKIGHWAIAIGSPYRYEGSFSVGVISSMFRSHTIRDGLTGPGRLYPSMIQTDAAINPGNSGGPLVNLSGEVIGINTAIESEGGGSVGIGFAIPINAAKYVIKQLMETGKVSYGYLGVDPKSVTPRDAAALHVEQGAYLRSDPPPESPAAKAGLSAGDVIISFGDTPVRSELDLRTAISQTPPGTAVPVTIVRDGERKSLSAVIERATREDYPSDRPAERGKPSLGIEVQPLTDKLAEKAGVPVKTAGVAIKSIDPSSSAADADELIEGLVVLRVNSKPTPNVLAFREAVASLKPGDQVRLVYQVGKEKHFVILSVD